ncbi:sensor histidine kinase, partial [Pseudomonas vancouverensis]
MTKNYSIYTKLIILFVVTFFLVCVLFIVLLKIERNAYNEEESLKQENLIKNLLISYENTSGVEIGAYLGNSGFNAIQNPHLVKAIRNNGQSLFKAGGELCTLSSLKYHSNLYFDVQCKDFDSLYEENTSDRVYNLLLIGFFSFSLLVVFMYFSVLRSLEPLKKLRRQVAEVVNGEQPDFLDYREDEVGK